MPLDIKICGLTREEDARMALEEGADFLGFVLYPRSPRFVSPIRLARILDRLPRSGVAVAVFVNASRAEVESVVRDLPLAAVQMHGDEPSEDFQQFAIPVWRAVRWEAEGWRPDPAAWPAARYVVDAAPPGRYGGSGLTADWRKASELARAVPVMLAGGLTPQNVREAVHIVRPAGVDVSSGVESEPGRKDPDRLKAFLRAARAI